MVELSRDGYSTSCDDGGRFMGSSGDCEKGGSLAKKGGAVWEGTRESGWL